MPLFLRKNCTSRTDFAAGAAMLFLYMHDTFCLIQRYGADSDQSLFRKQKRGYGAGGANLAAGVAIKIAMALQVIEFGLHNTANTIFQIGRHHYIGRADTHAEMTSRAVLRKMRNAS